MNDYNFNNVQSKHDLLIAVARMYYIDRLSQQEISQRVNVSRSNVSRLLKQCVEQRIVEFRIKDTTSALLGLQQRIQETCHLREVIILPAQSSSAQTRLKLGEAAVECLENNMKNGMLLGVSWGSTLYHVSKSFQRARLSVQSNVIQMVGGVNSQRAETDGQAIARAFASAFNGRPHLLHAPLFVSRTELKEPLMEEPVFRRHFELIDQIDVALVGIGATTPILSALEQAGYLEPDELNRLIEMGASGDVCGLQFNENGEPCAQEITDRIIGVSLEQLKRIPLVAGVVTGAEKVKGICSVLRSGIIDILIIDEAGAFAVMSNMLA